MDQIPIVHISDLHFSDRMTNNQFGWFEGYRPHDVQLCKGLTNVVEHIKYLWDLQEGESPRLIVTGDLTSSGRESEFAVAHSFIMSRWRLQLAGPEKWAGQHVSEGDLATVPGNHDHWFGRRVPPSAYNGGIIEDHFERTPWRKVWASSGGGFELEIFGVDSNSGLAGQWQNWPAIGRIQKEELNELEWRLEESDRTHSPKSVRRVRAILTHHSLSYRGGLPKRIFSVCELEEESRDRLLEIAAKYKVAAILTGHIHDAYHHDFPVRIDGEERIVRELRSPSTLQGPASKVNAGFLAHRLWLDQNGALEWTVWHYRWDGSRFLQDKGPFERFNVG